MNFRIALESDAIELSSLINSAYRGDSARAGWTFESDLVGGERTNPEEISSIVRKSDEMYLLAESENKIIGCVFVKIYEDAYFIGMLTVSPTLQNAGIGAKLLQEVETRARTAGKKFTRLDVIHVRAELIAWYERKGYVKTGHSEPFPSQYPAKLPDLRLLEMKKTL